MGDPVYSEYDEITSIGGVWREGSLEEAKLIPDRNDFSEGEDGEQAFDSAFAEAVNFSFNGRGGNLSEMLFE